MLSKRILSAAIFIPACLLIVIAGGWIFILAAACILGVGAWEFKQMFEKAQYSPNGTLLIVGTICLSLSKALAGLDLSAIIFSGLVLISIVIVINALAWGARRAGERYAG